MAHNTLIAWFRRDLRLHDQAAFYHACRDAAQVVPLFILDPALLSSPHVGGPRLTFLLESLRALDAGLRARGSYLVVRQGDPLEEIRAVLREANADGIYFNRDYIWPGRDRDDRVRAALREDGAMVETFADQVLIEPEALLTGQGRPYTVFTPYRNAWLKLEKEAPLSGPPAQLGTPPLRTLPIPAAADYGQRVVHPLPEPGEEAGRALLARFTGGDGAPILAYKEDRNFPALEGTSRLSPHLRHGTVGVRSAFAAAQRSGVPGGDGAATWTSELAWRDFYQQWVWHYPNVLHHAFDPAMDALPFEDDKGLYAAWCEGRTGFPIIDAAMRQINASGWMHNRLRMIVASFLCKDLLCDWRLGEDYFWTHLADGDKPANVGGWQWSASVGVDPQPYFRIFNPTTQGQRFDPDGTFIRRWVPELREVPARYIHVPTELPPLEAQRLGFALDRDYPHPVVDHATQRQRALAMYGAAKKG